MLSPTLKNIVTSHIYVDVFDENPIFKNQMNTVKEVIVGLIPNIRRPDEVIIT